jgi:hypothetical protein
MYFVQPSEGERYFLRLLLHHMPGATSFEDLACTNRHLQHPMQHASFKETCQQRGLLQDDAEWAQWEEVASMVSASCLRALFVALLVFNDVANPLALWERFKEDMAEDFLYQAHQVGAQLCPCMVVHVNLPCGFAWSWFACCSALNAHYVVCVLL